MERLMNCRQTLLEELHKYLSALQLQWKPCLSQGALYTGTLQTQKQILFSMYPHVLPLVLKGMTCVQWGKRKHSVYLSCVMEHSKQFSAHSDGIKMERKQSCMKLVYLEAIVTQSLFQIHDVILFIIPRSLAFSIPIQLYDEINQILLQKAKGPIVFSK